MESTLLNVQLAQTQRSCASHILRQAGYFDALLDFRHHTGVPDWVVVDLSVCPDHIFDIIYAHMLYPFLPLGTININDIERMADFLLYKPLQIIQMQVVYGQQPNDPAPRIIDTTHPHVPFQSNVSFHAQLALPRPLLLHVQYMRCINVVKEMVAQFHMSVTHLILRRYPDHWFFTLSLYNDGMESTPIVPYSSLQRGQDTGSLIEVYTHSYPPGKVKCYHSPLRRRR
jgi:hypothetical protein